MPTTKRGESFWEFFHSWRYFIVALALCLAVALFYAEEDWRGRWAWTRYQNRMAAQGDSLQASALLPPRVPDDKNFAMTPFLAPLFDFIPGSQKWASANPMQRVNAFAPKYDAAAHALKHSATNEANSWVKARLDLSAWYAAYLKSDTNAVEQKPLLKVNFSRQEAATGVLSELTECQGVLEELEGASRLPYTRFNLRYEEDNPAGILLPHLAVLKHLCQVLELRASARLALGQTEPAFQDVKLSLFLAQACRKEPFFISQLVRMAQFYIALQPLAEGLGQWSDPQLHELQQILANFDFCADAKRNMAGERAWGVTIIDYVARSAAKYNVLGNISGQPQNDYAGVLMMAAPDGWFDLEKLHYCRTFQEYVLPTIDLPNRRIRPDLVAQKTEQITNLISSSWPVAYLRHRFFGKLLLPGMSKFVRKTAFAQTSVDCAMLACGLERYRLAHAQYPSSLEALVPEFVSKLPRDIITGEPLKYRRLEDDRYLLYSVGWNNVDDGGVVSASSNGEDNASEGGDWVWRLP